MASFLTGLFSSSACCVAPPLLQSAFVLEVCSEAMSFEHSARLAVRVTVPRAAAAGGLPTLTSFPVELLTEQAKSVSLIGVASKVIACAALSLSLSLTGSFTASPDSPFLHAVAAVAVAGERRQAAVGECAAPSVPRQNQQ